jgi:hypothetical protein
MEVVIMKRAVALFLILTLATVTTVFAAATLTGDTFSNNSAKDVPQNGLGYLNVQSSGSGGGVCAVVNETFLKFDLSAVQGEVSSLINPSRLELTSVFGNGLSATGSLELWSTDSNDGQDDWLQTALTHNNKPSADRLLATVSLPVANGTVSFLDARLNTYLNEQTSWTGGGDTVPGNNVASFLIRINGCTLTSQVFFAEGSPVSTYGTGPRLVLYNPTAITLRTFRAADPAVNWPLIVGLGALAAVVVGGLAVSRRRAARG